MHAAFNSSREVVELLMGEDGVDVDKADSDGHTALWYALLGGDEDIVDKLAGKTKTKVGLEDTYKEIAQNKVKMTEALAVFVRQTTGRIMFGTMVFCVCLEYTALRSRAVSRITTHEGK